MKTRTTIILAFLGLGILGGQILFKRKVRQITRLCVLMMRRNRLSLVSRGMMIPRLILVQVKHLSLCQRYGRMDTCLTSTVH